MSTATPSRWLQGARFGAFVVLGLVTALGIYNFTTGDWQSAASFWRQKLPVLPLVAALAVLDVALEALGWMWVYERLGVRAFDRLGIATYLSGRAGLLLPAQLGRLIRPDGMARLGRGDLPHCLKAEAVAFVLDSTSVFALLAGLLAWRVHPLAAPVAALAVIGVSLYIGERLTQLVAGTRLELPKAFWLRWKSLVIVLIESLGWAAHGAALYIVVYGLPGHPTLWESLFYAPASAVLGVATGLPGGIGATEGFLGASLRLMSIPGEHLFVAVAAFRLLTFWAWLPIGWIALASLRRLGAVTGSDRESLTAEALAVRSSTVAERVGTTAKSSGAE